MEITLEQQVIAARLIADKAEDKCTKMALYVAQMQGCVDYYVNQTIVCKDPNEHAEAQANVLKFKQVLLDAHTEWNAALDKQGELWEKYCELLDAYERIDERADAKCTFCGEMERDCGGDHGDEMREIIRESCGW